jgi:hypothetical protein
LSSKTNNASQEVVKIKAGGIYFHPLLFKLSFNACDGGEALRSLERRRLRGNSLP